MAEHVSGEVVTVRLNTANKDFNRKVLEELEPLVEAEGLGQAGGMVSLADEGWTLLIDVAHAHAGKVATNVIPRVQALLKQLGVAGQAVVELAPVVEDDDEWEE